MSKSSSEKIDRAVGLYLSGDFQSAQRILEKIIKREKKNHNALRLLGLVKNKKGMKESAIRLIKKAIVISPDVPAYYNNLGEVYRSKGEYESAIYNYSKAISLNSKYAQAYNNLGYAQYESGMYSDAIDSFNLAIDNNKDYADAYSNCGNALRASGQLTKALEYYGMAIKLRPNFAEAYNNQGVVMQEMGDLYNALNSYNNAIQIRPDYAEAYNNLGKILTDTGNYEKAVINFNKAIHLRDDYAEAYNNLGLALGLIGDLKKAVNKLNRAIFINPQYAEAYNSLGNVFSYYGNIQSAVKSYEDAIRLNPNYAIAHRNLSLLKKYKPDDVQVKVMKEIIRDSSLDASDRKQILFALAKVYEDLGDYGKSFEHLREGNYIRKNELSYNIDNDNKLFVDIKKLFSHEIVKIDPVIGENDLIRPIFIVGMPRSGTSLVEQILASHSRVYGAGELKAMGKSARAILFNYSVHQNARELLLEIIEKVHKDYYSFLGELKIDEENITDKMPENFLWIGFILCAFPGAKIIHVNRDPMATCWSIYKNYFSSNGNGYAYDMNDLSAYYKLYLDLMSFWENLFPNGVYNLCYEDLTEGQEEETRKMLSYCGLEWEEQCLDFHKTDRAVKTASVVQVRHKMYKGSSESWRKFESYLLPLKKSLGYQE